MIYEGQRVYILGGGYGTVLQTVKKADVWDGTYDDGSAIYFCRVSDDDFDGQEGDLLVIPLGPDCPEEEEFDGDN